MCYMSNSLAVKKLKFAGLLQNDAKIRKIARELTEQYSKSLLSIWTSLHRRTDYSHLHSVYHNCEKYFYY